MPKLGDVFHGAELQV